MRPRFVPLHEMRWHRSHRDELDAMLDGSGPDGAADLAQVAAVLRRMRSTYGGPPPRPSGELAAFMEAPLTTDKGDLPVTVGSNANGPVAQVAGLPKWRETIERRRMKTRTAVSAFVASVAGKVVLGTAVAAASVGALHAADVVDLPVLPDNDPPAAVEEHGPDDGVGTQGHEDGGSGHGVDPDSADDFGEDTSTDAQDGGVVGSEISEDADDFGTGVAGDNTEGTPASIPEDPTSNASTGETAKDDALENDPTGNSSQGEEAPPEDAGAESAPDDVPPEDPASHGDDAREQFQP